MRRLVLLRHGQTAWNAEHRIQGQIDSTLDEVGLAQAAAVAPVVGALRPALLWTSDLARARRTAEVVGEACGLAPVADERLREYSLGRWEGTTHAEFAAADPAGFELFRTGRWDELLDAEPPEAVAKRFTACLGDLVDALGPDELGVAVAHGASIRTGLVAWLGWPPAAAADLGALTNCARVELAEREDGGWAVSAYNLAVL
jgi:probable phosphoglycerate mutase